jgi:succinyl-CoA synthetase beta subunit
MNLEEYKAKELFSDMEIPIVKGITIKSVEELEGKDIKYPVVVKAQVHTGGRGKEGGVLFAESKKELVHTVKKMLASSIRGFKVNKVLVLHKIEVEKELYLSIMLDRSTKTYLVIFSPEGGMDIEETAKSNPDKIYKINIDPLLGIQRTDIRFLADRANLSKDLVDDFIDIVIKLYKLCVQYHCTLAEINPLVVTPYVKEGGFIALDAKITVDDNAVCKFSNLIEYKESIPIPKLVREASSYNFLYIPCDSEGRVVVMSNGSGMIMTTIDGLSAKGVKVSAALDLGGGATKDRIREAIRILFETEKTEILFINIFGGITRSDEVAKGIVESLRLYDINKTVVVRLEGTNKEKGLEILKGFKQIKYVDNLKYGIQAVIQEVGL